MGCITLSPEVWERIRAVVDVQYVWVTDWIPAAGVGNVKPLLKLKNVTGDVRIRAAAQTAAVRTNNPDAPAAIQSSYTQVGAGEKNDDTLSVAALTSDKSFIRFGYAYWADSGAGLADASMQVAFEAFGKVVGTRTFAVRLAADATLREVVTGWLPTMMVTKVKAAFVMTDAADLEYRLCWQAALTSVQQPDVWETLYSYSSDNEVATDEETPDFSGAFWVRFGVECHNADTESCDGLVTAMVSILK